MGTPRPNRLPLILGSLLLGLAVAFGILRTTYMQTHLCTSLLNRLTQPLGLAWEIGEAEIRLFPLRLYADEIQLYLADGSMASIAAFESEMDAAAWMRGEKRIRHVHIEGVEALLASMDQLLSTSTEAEPTAFELAIDDLKIDHVGVSTTEPTLPNRLTWERLRGSQIQWTPLGILGAVEVHDASLAPPNSASDEASPLSMLSGTTTIETLKIQAHPSDSAQHWAAQLSSNWGGIEVHAASSSAELKLNVDWEPDPEHWPIDSAATWSPTLRRMLDQEQLKAQLSVSPSGGALGQLEWGGLVVPWNWQAKGWGFGPVAVDSEAYVSLAGLFGLTLPTYLTDHRTWMVEVVQNKQDWQATATPQGSRKKKITLAWDGGIEHANVTANLHGFAINPEGAELESGLWSSTLTVHRDDTDWHGTLNTEHPAGDEISTKWNAEWADSTWMVESTTQIQGLSNAANGESPPWELHTLLNWRASGTRFDSWVQIAELRNVVLLEDGTPRSFNRFDAIQTKRGDAWSLNWDSDLTNGSIACNSAALTDWRFDPWGLAWKPKGPAPAELPEVEVRASFTNFRPISLLANLPFTAPEPFEFGGTWQGNSGEVHARIPELTVGALDVEAISIRGAFGTGKSEPLTVAVGAVAYNDAPCIKELTADAITDARGLSVFIQTLSGQWMDENFNLNQPLHARWDKSTQLLSAAPFALQSEHGIITCSGSFASEKKWSLTGAVEVDSVSFPLGTAPLDVVKLSGDWSIQSQEAAPELNARIQLNRAEWNAFDVRSMQLDVDGPVANPHLAFTARLDSVAMLEGAFNVPLNALHRTEGTVRFDAFPLRTINAFLPPSSIEIDGVAHGSMAVSTAQGMPALEGEITAAGAKLTVPYLGTHYGIHGTVVVQPDGFYMNQWQLVDQAGRSARFNGTALHSAFVDWSLDFGVDVTEEPIELMNIPASDDALFYGTASGTGDINISGHGPYLQFDAQIATAEGTDFALPLDSRSDVNHAEFIRFRTAEAPVLSSNKPRGVFSDISLNLGIDVRDGAQASIVFDRNVGDEIVGKATGHLDLEIDDFERLSMTGDLEITEGAYYFTLQNWLNKRFDIRPGSTIAWQGDPYDAQLDIATIYTARTKLDPLLPEVTNLPGRLPIDLGLALKGSLLSPDLDFKIDVPTADSRIQALMDGALISEEEVQRQALGLLVMNQFIPLNPTEAAVGGFIQPAQSTQFLANQLGHWISQIAPSMDVGLDYAQDALSGEQALGLALSTQLWNDRLHIEGELGAQALGQVHADDVQIQDLTVSFDLTPEGNVQLTGHSRQNANLTNTIEGQTVQGVGLRFKWSFDKWGDWRSK